MTTKVSCFLLYIIQSQLPRVNALCVYKVSTKQGSSVPFRNFKFVKNYNQDIWSAIAMYQSSAAYNVYMSEQQPRLRIANDSLMCKNGCDFYGNKKWNNLCSKCYRRELSLQRGELDPFSPSLDIAPYGFSLQNNIMGPVL